MRGGLRGGDTGAAVTRSTDTLFSVAPRKDVVSVVSTYQYPDPEDAFSREPFVVKFSAPGCGELIPPPTHTPPSYRLSLTLTSPLSTAAKELVLIPLHAAPNQAVAEIDALYDVYLDVIDKWNTDVGSPSPRPPTPVPDYHKCSPRFKMCLLCLPPGHAVSG